ncbi:MAG: response regulator [Lachnospiraceae bacterium]|nr:response regulator [Lachnospiraceae bacterium]
MTEKVRLLLGQLRQSIYTGERREKQMNIIFRMGYIIAAVGALMTVLNIVQHKGAVTYTTIAICAAGIIISVAVKVFDSLKVAIIAAWIFCIFIFTYYTINGTNEGFAILWTLMVPLALGYFCGILYGLSVSVYYELLFMVLFYTPIRNSLSEYYSATFMLRYPILYLTSILLNSVAMISNHVCTLTQMEYEERLKEALDIAEEESARAQAANESKSAFLSHMSHEIRTPINTILGMNEMILRECNDDTVLSYSDNINNAGSTLLGIINDILDFSKIEAGKMEIIPVEYDLSSVLNDLVNMAFIRADEKGLELKLDFDEAIPKQLFGDEIRIKQIITNILTNAVKYTEKGSVTFGINFEKTAEPDVILMKVSVKDTGIGIKEEDMKKLFSEFDRIEEKRNRHVEGTGLGMSITKRLLEMMDSSLKVESVYGKGSTFSFSLKQTVVSSEPLGNYGDTYREHVKRRDKYREKFTAPDANILIVDDNPMNLMVFQSLIKRTLVAVDTAEDGDRGLVMASRKKYDIIFLDHMMPGKDGIETLHELKADKDGINYDTTVICITANAISGAKEGYIKEGFAGYISKPIDAGELEDMLMMYIPKEKLCEPAAGDDDSKENGNISTTGADKTDELAFLKGSPIDLKEGLKNNGNKENYLLILKIFVDSTDDKINELERLYNSEDYNGYTIKVHAMKSSARIIGAVETGEKAQKLETAGKNNDIDFIKANHEAFINEYRSLKELVMPLFEKAPEAGKPEADDELIENFYDSVKEAARSQDCDMLDAIFAELGEYSMPSIEADRWEKIHDAYKAFDYEKIVELVKDREGR